MPEMTFLKNPLVPVTVHAVTPPEPLQVRLTVPPVCTRVGTAEIVAVGTRTVMTFESDAAPPRPVQVIQYGVVTVGLTEAVGGLFFALPGTEKPEPVQEFAPVDCQESVTDWPLFIVYEEAESVTVGGTAAQILPFQLLPAAHLAVKVPEPK